MKISDLKKGDLFRLGDKAWDKEYKFLRIEYYSDKENMWYSTKVKNTRSCVFMSDGSFAWWDTNTEVFIK